MSITTTSSVQAPPPGSAPLSSPQAHNVAGHVEPKDHDSGYPLSVEYLVPALRGLSLLRLPGVDRGEGPGAYVADHLEQVLAAQHAQASGVLLDSVAVEGLQASASSVDLLGCQTAARVAPSQACGPAPPPSQGRPALEVRSVGVSGSLGLGSTAPLVFWKADHGPSPAQLLQKRTPSGGPECDGSQRSAQSLRTREKISRTVHIADLNPGVSESRLIAMFLHCGPVVDCRVCGDTMGHLRFGFIEFGTQEAAAKVSRRGLAGHHPLPCQQNQLRSRGSAWPAAVRAQAPVWGPGTAARPGDARRHAALATRPARRVSPPLLQALMKNGTMFGSSIIKIRPSRTAIIPVKNSFL